MGLGRSANGGYNDAFVITADGEAGYYIFTNVKKGREQWPAKEFTSHRNRLRDFAKKIPGARRFVRAIRRLRFIYRLKRITPTGPGFDLFCDFLYAWNRLQYRPRIRRPRTFNELVLASKHDMALARRVTDKVHFKEWLAETPAWRDLIVPTLEVFDAPFLLRGRVFEAGTILKPTHMSGDAGHRGSAAAHRGRVGAVRAVAEVRLLPDLAGAVLRMKPRRCSWISPRRFPEPAASCGNSPIAFHIQAQADHADRSGIRGRLEAIPAANPAPENIQRARSEQDDFQGNGACPPGSTWLAETPAWRDLIVPTLEVFDAPFLLRVRGGTILKPTHMSGKTLVRGSAAAHRGELAQFEQWQRFDYYRISREPCYAGLKPRIILEPLLRDQDGQPVTDFKFHMIGR